MNFSEAIKCINTTAISPENVTEEERREALSACERLRASLETPMEGAFRFSSTVFSTFFCLVHPLRYLVIYAKFLRYVQIQQAIALRLAVDMKLFDTAAKASSNGGPVQIAELSSEASADPLLVSM